MKPSSNLQGLKYMKPFFFPPAAMSRVFMEGLVGKKVGVVCKQKHIRLLLKAFNQAVDEYNPAFPVCDKTLAIPVAVYLHSSVQVLHAYAAYDEVHTFQFNSVAIPVHTVACRYAHSVRNVH